MTQFRRDLASKSAVGGALGFTLALALAGLFAVAGPGGVDAPNKYQLVMWLIAPIWLGVASLVFLFRSGLRALLWIGGANVVAYGGLFLFRQILK